MDAASAEILKPDKLNVLTSLRFFAASLILLHHSFEKFHFGAGFNLYLPTYQAVSFFFVLSGFILTYVYRGFDSRQSIRRFFVARFARIWPLHCFNFVLILILLKERFGHMAYANGFQLSFLKKAVANLLLIQAWIPDSASFWSFNAVSWSISNELAFYLLFPVLVSKIEQTWKIKLLFTFGLSIGVVFLCDFFKLPGGPSNAWGSFGIVCINPIVRVFEFMVGIATAHLFLTHSSRYNPGKTTATIIEVFAVMVVLMGMGANQYLQSCFELVFHEPGRLWVDNGSSIFLLFGFLIFIMACEKGALSQFLSARVFVFLGEISFAMYLLHQILLRVYGSKILPGSDTVLWVEYLQFLMILFLGSYLLWEGLEKVCRTVVLSHVKNRNGFGCLKAEISKLAKNRVFTVSLLLLGILLIPFF